MRYCLLCNREILPKITWQVFLQPALPKICLACEAQFQPIEGSICEKCGRPWQEEMCHDCIRWEAEMQWAGILGKNTALYLYNKPMKEMIARWKFRGDIVLIHIFQRQIVASWEKLSRDIDMVVPIPLSEERLYERGFNQAAEIAKLFPVPFHELLVRVNGEKQSKKKRQERIKSDPFFHFGKQVDIRGKRILLVDDVYTTGTTLRHGAKILKDHGAKGVVAFTIAR